MERGMNHYIAYLADHPTYVAEVAELKYAQWRHTSPDRPYQVWVAEIEHSARKGELPMTLVALPRAGRSVGWRAREARTRSRGDISSF